MRTIVEVFCVFEKHIGLFLAVFSLLFAWYSYCRNLKCKKIKTLAKQVIAYYSLEQEAVKEIQTMTNENIKTIKVRLRRAAQNNQENLENEYPSMTAKGARRYL